MAPFCLKWLSKKNQWTFSLLLDDFHRLLYYASMTIFGCPTSKGFPQVPYLSWWPCKATIESNNRSLSILFFSLLLFYLVVWPMCASESSKSLKKGRHWAAFIYTSGEVYGYRSFIYVSSWMLQCCIVPRRCCMKVDLSDAARPCRR